MERDLWKALVTVAVCVAVVAPVSAIDIEVDTSMGGGQVGGFYGPYDPGIDDPPVGYPSTLAPDNLPTFQNYYMGRTTLGPLGSSPSTPERRAFFMFDMTGVLASVPAGHTISGLSIDLTLTPGGSAVLANFSGGVESVEFSSTPFTEMEILDPVGEGVSTDAIWGSFGTSTPYGSFDISGTPPSGGSPASADGVMTLPPDTYTIDLMGGIPDVETAIGAGGIFIVSARLSSFDPDVIGPGTPPAVDPYEYVFGITDVVPMSGGSPSVPAPILTISTIPEPSSVLLITIFGSLLFMARRSRS